MAILSDDEVKLRISTETTGESAVEQLAKNIDDLAKQGGEAAPALGVLANQVRKVAANADTLNASVSKSTQSIGNQLSELKVLYAAWLSAQAAAGAVAGIAQTADAYANLTAKVKMAVGEGVAFDEAFQGVEDIALRTNTSLEVTGQLFAKLVETGKQMGFGQAEALRLTETVNQSIQLSGASAQASNAAVVQLIQGLQSGVLRGDEFNSIMEQSPRLAKALAEGLGVTTGELRKMADAGQLSTATVISALSGQAAIIDREFSKLPATIGRAITDLNTQWQIWIGSVDQSTGASAAAAGVIESLAKNFDLVASSLMNAGQAYLGWKAYNIAAEFLSLKSAVTASAVAKTADTAATVANTAATTSNTAAQVANNAAKAGAAAAADVAAASTGRLAGALSLVKGLSLAFLLTNLSDIGKWMGEAAAKAMGYGKVIEENERQMKAAEAAAKAMSAADAEVAQKKQLAADKALGLSERSKTLVADFGELTKKGETTAAALGKIGKDMDLSNVKGIADAGAALDALAVRGKISADQVRDAWQQALNGQDLQKFEVQARAAFDGSEQGARRLAAALEAQLGEALRRTGLDAGELSNGINKAAQSSINNFDVLIGRVDDLRKQGVDTGIALSASLNQAGKAATTEAAAKAVLDRWVELGNAGLVTGERLAQGLSAARDRLDTLKPGINSLSEAFEALGLKSREALQKAEDSAREAFEYIKANGGTINELRAAWEKYGAAAKAANGGILPDVLRLQEEMYKVGDAGEKAAERIGAAWDSAAEKVDGYSRAASAANDKWSTDTAGRVIVGGSDVSALAAQNTTSDTQAKIFESIFAGIYNRIKDRPEYFSSTQGLQTAAIERDAVAYAKDESARQIQAANSSNAAYSASSGSSQSSSSGFQFGSRNVITVNINTPSGTKTVNTADRASADALVKTLKELASVS